MEEIDIKELLTVFWKRKILILIVTVVFALAGLVYCGISKTPIYEASTTLILTPERIISANLGDSRCVLGRFDGKPVYEENEICDEHTCALKVFGSLLLNLLIINLRNQR